MTAIAETIILPAAFWKQEPSFASLITTFHPLDVLKYVGINAFKNASVVLK